jgi:predicted transcriptional regulator
MNGEKIIRAKDVMSQDFILVEGLATVAEALEQLREKQARCIIVKKRHDDDEYGILLLSDIAKKVIGPGRSPKRVNVYEIMSKPIIAIRPVMDVRYIARLFESFGISMAPVLHSSEVLGVVSYQDITLKAFA